MTQNQSDKTASKKTRRWTAIDTVLLLLALVVVLGVVFRAIDFFKDDDLRVTHYHVYFTGVQEVYHTVPAQIGERDNVYLYGTQTRLGYIEGANVLCGEKDHYQNVTFSGYFTVDDGVLEDDGRLSIQDGAAYLKVGEVVVICTDRVALEIRVDAIETQVIDLSTADSDTEADGTDEATEKVEEIVTEPSEEEETTEASADESTPAQNPEDTSDSVESTESEPDSDPAETTDDNTEESTTDPEVMA